MPIQTNHPTDEAPKHLEFGGWANGGFITKSQRGSVSAEDRTALIDWLRARSDVASARVSDLVDAWYTDFVTEDALAPVVG